MSRIIRKLSKVISLMLCAFIFVMGFSSCASKKVDDETFSISGYVWDEYGDPVEGVTVSTSFSQTETDKDGKYTFVGLNGSVVVSVEKEGYQFETSNKLVKNENDDDNFTAYKEYVLTGTVHNNSAAVEKATVLIESISGVRSVETDEYGSFSVSGMAGETRVSCEVDDMQFYTVTASRANTNVSINTTSSLTVNFESEDGDELDFDKIQLFVDGEEVERISNKVVVPNIYCGTMIELKSNYYNFDNPIKFAVERLNQENTFVLSEIYSISGNVKSGSFAIANANVMVDGKTVAVTDELGNFEVSGLSSSKNVTASLAGWKFNNVDVNKQNKAITLVGRKDVFVFVDKDFDSGNEFIFENKDYSFKNGRFTISDVLIGDEVKVSAKNYHFDENSFSVGTSNSYVISAFAKYNARVAGVDGLSNIVIYLDGNEVQASALSGLSKIHNITASYSNYEFSTETVNFRNTVANLKYKMPYDVEITAKSGDVDLSNAKALVAGKVVANADEFGKISIEHIYGRNTITISCENYNSFKFEVQEATSKDVSLSYNVTGHISSGSTDVFGAKVESGSNFVLSANDGTFKLEGLEGTAQILVSKEGYSFDAQTVTHKSDLNFDGTYSITVDVMVDDGQDIDEFNVVLKDPSNPVLDVYQAVASESGVEFTELSGEYILMCKQGDVFNSLNYVVDGPKHFVFSSSVYEVSGYVKTGDIPIAYAKVKTGSLFTFTDENGFYKFDCLTDAVSEISVVEMQGYVFSAPQFVSEDTENLNFTATYTAGGIILMGTNPIEGVEVFVNGSETKVATTDANGKFSVSGLSGQNVFSFEKEGYNFAETITVSGVETKTAHATVQVSVTVQTGDLNAGGTVVEDYEIYVNGVRCLNLSAMTLSEGDEITFKKEGYEFDKIVISAAPQNYQVQATYKLAGKVVSGDVNLSDYEIYVNDKPATNIIFDGENFEISKLSGATKISVLKPGFTFADQTKNSYLTNLVFDGSYRVYGYTKIGKKALADVEVSCGETTTETNESGYFEFSGITGNFDLEFEKDGYHFANVENKFGEQQISVEASYDISGVVKTGDLVVAQLQVILVTNEGVEIDSCVTNENGEFKFTQISGVASIMIPEQKGYSRASISGISDLTTGKVIKVQYEFTVDFGLPGVQVSLNGKKETVLGNSRKFSGLEGTNEIKFELANTAFKLNDEIYTKYTITGPGSISFTATKSYNVSGYVKTKGNKIPLSGMKVSLLTDTEICDITDENGYYELKNVAGDLVVNGFSGTLAIDSDSSATKSYDFELADKAVINMLYANATEKIQNSPYLQVEGSGPVVGVAMGIETTQNAYSVYKRDANGNVIRKNQNTGEVVNAVIMQVDPNVSFAAAYLNTPGNGYTSGSNPKIWYQKLDGKGNVSHTYSNAAPNSTVDAYVNSFKSNPITSYIPYIINSTTIVDSSYSNISQSGSNYVFSFNLNTGKGTQPGYETQIETLAPKGTTFLSWSSITLTFTITNDGWISKIHAKDVYKINQTTDVTVTSNIDYIFTNYTDNDIIYSVNDTSAGRYTVDVNKMLKVNKKNKAQAQSATIQNFKQYDILTNVIYGN